MGEVEVRCPVGNKMFAKLLVDDRLAEDSPRIVEDNLVEFSCSECRKVLRSRGRIVERVLHRYNILGELIETVAVA